MWVYASYRVCSITYITFYSNVVFNYQILTVYAHLWIKRMYISYNPLACKSCWWCTLYVNRMLDLHEHTISLNVGTIQIRKESSVKSIPICRNCCMTIIRFRYLTVCSYFIFFLDSSNICNRLHILWSNFSFKTYSTDWKF